MNEKACIWTQCIDMDSTLKPQILDKASIATKISQCKAKISPVDPPEFGFTANGMCTAPNVEAVHSNLRISYNTCDNYKEDVLNCINGIA